MRRAVLFAFALAVLLSAVPAAQQAGNNINVLPAHVDPNDPTAFLKGDLFMQRQVESVIAPSSRNPDHLMVFFNDYRAVDVGNDFGVGEQVATRGIAARLLGALFRLPERLAGRKRQTIPSGNAATPAEAFVGYSVSYDRGVSWSGGLIPGSPKDFSAASLDSPIRGVAAATDPVVMSAPCGYFYVAYIGFTRGPGGKSYVAVSRFLDKNNTGGKGEDIVYVDTQVLAQANNDNPNVDTFVDKPAIGVDTGRPALSLEPCNHRVYVAYTVFDGPETPQGFNSRIMVARSTNNGNSWQTPVKISGNFKQNQGVSLAVDPMDDGGSVYAMWRQFKPGADAMIWAPSFDYGDTWRAPKIITPTPLAPFDQPSLSKPDPAFRTNGFPSMAVTHTGRIYGVWQERVNLAACATNGPQCGLPMANGTPRIVLMRSTDFGNVWTDDRGAVGKRRAVDIGDRDEESVQPGFGAKTLRPSFPQVMPKLATGAGKMLLTFYEARAELSGPFPGFITGLNRRLDFRFAQLNPANGRLIGGGQVSRYDIRSNADLTNGKEGSEADLAQVAPGVAAVSRVNGLTSNAGTQPFLGDYTDLVPAVQFVNTSTGWHFANTEKRAGNGGFYAVFADNRYQIPPTTPGDIPEMDRYPFYSPPGTGMASCINPGSRNTDVISAHIAADLVVGAPVTFKALTTIQRSFPVYVSNRSNERRFFRLTISRGAGFSSFDQVSDLDVIDAEILPQSGIVRSVFVDPRPNSPAAAVSIDVVQITAIGGTVVPGGGTGSVTLNADPTTTPAGDPTVTNTESHNPTVTNNGAPTVTNYPVDPTVTNVGKLTPTVTNPTVTNQTASTPTVTNSLLPDQPVYEITDVTWEVENAGNSASSFLSLINLPNGIDLQQFYKFHLTIFRRSQRAVADANCNVTNISYDQQIANIPNPTVTNDLAKNLIVADPTVTNPTVTNATFAEGPSGLPPPLPGGPVRAPRVKDTVFVNLRGYKVVPVVPANLVFGSPQNLPNFAVIANERNIENGVLAPAPAAAFYAPDLVFSGDGTPAFTPSTIIAGGAGELGGSTMRNAGNAAASVPDDAVINDRIYLSSDPLLDPSDLPLATGASFDSLQPGQSVPLAPHAVIIPPGVAPGPYYILRVLDANLLVKESEELNNVSATPITVTSGAAAGSLTFEGQPTDGLVSQPIAPPMRVRLRDAQGAVIPGVAVRLLLNTGQLLDRTSQPGDVSGTAELLEPTTIVTDVSGLATFAGTRVNRPALGYSIVASAPGALARTSTLFDRLAPEPVTCGNVAFVVSPTLAMGLDPRSVAVADFNGDGRPDVITANRMSNNVSVRLGQAGGGLGEPTHFPVLAAPIGLVTADFNGDDLSDVVVISVDGTNILRGLPTGDLSLAANVVVSDGQTGITTGDFNQDGWADVAIARTNGDGGGRLAILRGTGAAGFLAPMNFNLTADNPGAVTTGDFNGDGFKDLAVTNPGAGTVEILLGAAGGGLFAPAVYPAGTQPVALAVGDLNGDSRPDIVTSVSTGVAVLLQTPAGGFAAPVTTALGSDSRRVVLGDVNGDGRLDIASANAENFTLMPGNGAGGFGPHVPLDPNFEPRGLAAADLDGDHRLDVVVVNGSPANGVTILQNSCSAGPMQFVVTNTFDSGPGSLRQAILDANANPHSDTIRFQINTGPQTIAPLSVLPVLDPFNTVDGTTQPGWEGRPIIELSGQNLGANGTGLGAGGNCVIRGLVINQFSGRGLVLLGGNNTVQGNFVGTDGTGTVARPNLVGIQVDSGGNVIGGDSPTARNVVSGNSGHGIAVGFANSNSIIGNYVGTTVTGTAPLGNGGFAGIGIIVGSFNLVARNVVAANVNGISITSGSFSNRVEANFIGTDRTGTLAIPNVNGVVIGFFAGSPGNNVVGGTTAAAGNVISGNSANGVVLATDHSTVRNNLIGLAAGGENALGNGQAGVFIDGSTTFGFGNAELNFVQDNTIAGNGGAGVLVSGAGGFNSITSNRVGTNQNGTAARGNENGIEVGAPNTWVLSNLVSGNRQSGIVTTGNGTRILGNRVGINHNNSAPIGNSTTPGHSGIAVFSADNLIGGLDNGFGNVVSATNGYGIGLSGSGATRNIVQGNLVGVGLPAMGNTWGILLFAAGVDNLIGSTQTSGRNVFSNSPQGGIGVYSTTGTTIQGNYIGTNALGEAGMPNGDGVEIVDSTGTTFGGLTPGAGNVVASSQRYGMFLYQSSGNTVVGNRFGISPNGAALGNAEYALVIDGPAPSNNNTIGPDNLIAYNGAAGIFLGNGTGNVIPRNSIFSNGGLGIDIGGDGITPNDQPDSNGKPNFPIVENAYPSGYISGQLRSKPNMPFTLSFYNSPTCDPSGNGEGATFITERDVTTNADGIAIFSLELASLPNGTVVTATTTSATEGTSEFSACKTVTTPSPDPVAAGLVGSLNSRVTPQQVARR